MSPEFQISAITIDSIGKWHSSSVDNNIPAGNVYIQDISPNGNGLIYLNQSDDEGALVVSCFLDGESYNITLPRYIFSDAVDIQIVNRNTPCIRQ